MRFRFDHALKQLVHGFLYGDSDTPPHLVAFYDHAGDTEDKFSS